jgi:GNAT superfamily N-acetyltransferase
MTMLMKPLLIIAPAPARWHALADLVAHKEPQWLEDIEKRIVNGVDGGQDAFAVIPEGGRLLAGACINRRHDIGILGHVFTRAEHRGLGFARRLITTLLSWFDMSGGKWLHLGTTADVAERVFAKFGFKITHRASRQPHDRVMMLRTADGLASNPLDNAVGEPVIHDVSRADWPLIVSLLQRRPGPDPRVSSDESAVTAEVAGLDLITQQENGTCRLRAAFCGDCIVSLASVATDQLGERTYAMLIPHSDPAPGLREAVVEFARSKGYSQVDFPMEALSRGRAEQAEPSGQTTPTDPPPEPPADQSGDTAA